LLCTGPSNLGILQDQGVEAVSHYAPLHYLPFIGRSRALKSKPALASDGFEQTHFRSKSRDHDIKRGFRDFAFLTLDTSPRIVKAKLAGGFPHIALLIPSAAIENQGFELCRFNVAMTRRLRRDGQPGWPESDTNGRYFGGREIPTARSNADISAMLQQHLQSTMIEVLIRNELPLPQDTRVVAYHPADLELVANVLQTIKSPWAFELAEPPGPYPRKKVHADRIRKFVETSLATPKWRGDGLEFDKV
jgi:hypothetical protein